MQANVLNFWIRAYHLDCYHHPLCFVLRLTVIQLLNSNTFYV